MDGVRAWTMHACAHTRLPLPGGSVLVDVVRKDTGEGGAHHCEQGAQHQPDDVVALLVGAWVGGCVWVAGWGV